jgi:Tfp pilus assembly protein PilV
MRGNEPRRGSALIEVLVALVLLAIGGTALIVLLGQTAQSMRSTVESERLTRTAFEQLDWIALESRGDLIARIGRTSVRGWTIDVRQASPSTFDVAVASSDTTSPLVHTTLYRPDTIDAKP